MRENKNLTDHFSHAAFFPGPWSFFGYEKTSQTLPIIPQQLILTAAVQQQLIY